MSDSSSRNRSNSRKDLVGFLLGGVHYAIDISSVWEILPPIEITQLPHTPPEVAGVAEYRGDVIPVIDLRVRFGLEPQEEGRSTKWIRIRTGEGASVGIIVDAVTEVFGRGEGLRPSPDIGGDKDRRGIAGVLTHEGKLTFVLDTARFTELFDALAASGVL